MLRPYGFGPFYLPESGLYISRSLDPDLDMETNYYYYNLLTAKVILHTVAYFWHDTECAYKKKRFKFNKDKRRKEDDSII